MKPYLKTKDHSVSQEPFELLWDRELDLLVTQPVPDRLAPYYESGDYISHTDANESLLERIYQIIKGINLKRKLHYLENQADSPNTLLDIGAGTGDFLHLARTKGYTVFGMEPNARARQLAANKDIHLAADYGGLPQGKYQFITLWHVLEHMPDLQREIHRMVSLLEANGTLVVAVPNFRAWDAKHYGSYWAAYDVPRHLWHFSKTAMGKLFAREDMEIVSIHPLWFDAFYVSLLSERYKGGSFPWPKGIWYGLCSNLKALRSGEYSSLIYVLKRKNRPS